MWVADSRIGPKMYSALRTGSTKYVLRYGSMQLMDDSILRLFRYHHFEWVTFGRGQFRVLAISPAGKYPTSVFGMKSARGLA